MVYAGEEVKMKQSIKLFAYLAEQLGAEAEIQLPALIGKQIILENVAEAFPAAKPEIMECNVAINQAFVSTEEYHLESVEEIALIPPVSGG